MTTHFRCLIKRAMPQRMRLGKLETALFNPVKWPGFLNLFEEREISRIRKAHCAPLATLSKGSGKELDENAMFYNVFKQ